MLEIIMLILVLMFGLIGTTFVVYSISKCNDPEYNGDLVFISGLFGWLPIGALAFSILMLIEKL